MLLGSNDDLTGSENGGTVLPAKRSGLSGIDFGYDIFEERLHSADTGAHPLFDHGVCKWPGCEVELVDLEAFVR